MVLLLVSSELVLVAGSEATVKLLTTFSPHSLCLLTNPGVSLCGLWYDMPLLLRSDSFTPPVTSKTEAEQYILALFVWPVSEDISATPCNSV